MYIPTTTPNGFLVGKVLGPVNSQERLQIELHHTWFDEVDQVARKLVIEADVDRKYAVNLQLPFITQDLANPRTLTVAGRMIDEAAIYAEGDTVHVRYQYSLSTYLPGDPPGSRPTREYDVAYWVIGKYTGPAGTGFP